MGESCRRSSVLALLVAVEEILFDEGVSRRVGAGLAAATAAYRS